MMALRLDSVSDIRHLSRPSATKNIFARRPCHERSLTKLKKSFFFLQNVICHDGKAKKECYKG